MSTLPAHLEKYEVVETKQSVRGIDADLITRSERRARRRARKLNERRLLPSYRWEVVRPHDRWLVVAFQNVLREKAP